MNPPEAADLCAPGGAPLAPAQGLLLRDGLALLLFEGDAAPPTVGRVVEGDRVSPWRAECWRSDAAGATRWFGVALVEALPLSGGAVLVAEGARRALIAPPKVDVTPDALVDMVRRSAIDGRAVFAFLVRHLLEGRPEDCANARAHRAFARDFLMGAAEPDGFIEIVAAPDFGGLFAQGWSVSLEAGRARLASVADDLAVQEVDVALFDREDVLAPARGFCFFGLRWPGSALGALDAVFFEREGRLLRLDVVRGALLTLSDAAATRHVADMLPRLDGPPERRRPFKRICRPRYQGEDTLSQTALPIAAAVDALLQAPDGGLLATGWLLDPQRRVERVLIKSAANLYAPIHGHWERLPRPDLVTGFGGEPRFAGLLDPRDTMHGFIAHAAAGAKRPPEDEVYLELVLDDDSCLFRPLRMRQVASAACLGAFLAGLPVNEPELGRIVADHLAPFLAAVPPKAVRARRDLRPIRLAGASGGRETAAIMPFRRLAELHPVFALLAGSPEAEAIELTLVAPRTVAADAARRLGEALAFYGLAGSLVVADAHEGLNAQLDHGLEASAAERVLAWLPSALPQSPGWLAALSAEAAALPEPGLISPALIYEDRSIYFSGGGAAGLATGGRARLGYASARLTPGPAQPVPAAAAEIALVDRALLAAAGGFSGPLFSEAYAHLDLADRLRAAGGGCWCSGRTAFWILEDVAPPEPDPVDRLMKEVDAALLARRAARCPTETAR